MYDQGSRVTCSSFAMFYAVRATDPAGPRAGFTTPRALGKAVIRNRLRRRMREAVRLEMPQFAASIDYVFHPRHGVMEIEFPRLRREVVRLLRQCEAAAR